MPRERRATIAGPHREDVFEVTRGVDGSWCWTRERGHGGDVHWFGPRGLVAGGSWWGRAAVRFTVKE